jgi:hypothetical protein
MLNRHVRAVLAITGILTFAMPARAQDPTLAEIKKSFDSLKASVDKTAAPKTGVTPTNVQIFTAIYACPSSSACCCGPYQICLAPADIEGAKMVAANLGLTVQLPSGAPATGTAMIKRVTVTLAKFAPDDLLKDPRFKDYYVVTNKSHALVLIMKGADNKTVEVVGVPAAVDILSDQIQKADNMK